MSYGFRVLPWFSLAALSLALAGCQSLGSSTRPGQGQGPLELSAELTSKSPVNVLNASRYASFALQLEAGEVIEVRQSQAINGSLSLLDDQQRLVSGPSTSSLALTPQKSGRYTLYLSANDASTYGPFSLTLNKLNVRNSGEVKAGEKVAGLLSHKDGNRYRFEVAQAGIYRIDLTSEQMDTQLFLEGPALKLDNDDGPDGTNSRLEAYLEPGTYQLMASALDEAPNGTYLLSVNQRPLPEGVALTNSGNLSANQPITGLASAAALTYNLELEQPAFVDLTMRSSEVDSFLSLAGNGLEISDDDGAGSGTDARISQFLPAGSYQVQASSMDKKAGLFTLTYSRKTLRQASGTSLVPDQYMHGTLTHGRTHYAVLTISQSGPYQIDLSANDFDAVLRIEGREIDAEDDDSGGARNARLQVELEPGEYRLHIKGVESSSRGRYQLSVQSLN